MSGRACKFQGRFPLPHFAKDRAKIGRSPVPMAARHRPKASLRKPRYMHYHHHERYGGTVHSGRGFDQLAGNFGYSPLAIPAAYEMSVVAAELRETGDALLYEVRSAVECETAGLNAEQPGAERPYGSSWGSYLGQ